MILEESTVTKLNHFQVALLPIRLNCVFADIKPHQPLIGAKPQVIVPSFQYAVNRIVGKAVSLVIYPIFALIKPGQSETRTKPVSFVILMNGKNIIYSLILHYIVNAAGS